MLLLQSYIAKMNSKIESFQKVIDAVLRTGVGFKKLIFHMNMNVEDITIRGLTRSSFTEDEEPGKEDLIIKMSDGNDYLGKLIITPTEYKLMNKAIKGENTKLIVNLSNVGGILYDSKLKIEIYLHLNVYPELGESVGYAIVQVLPEKNRLNEWFNQEP